MDSKYLLSGSDDVRIFLRPPPTPLLTRKPGKYSVVACQCLGTKRSQVSAAKASSRVQQHTRRSVRSSSRNQAHSSPQTCAQSGQEGRRDQTRGVGCYQEERRERAQAFIEAVREAQERERESGSHQGAVIAVFGSYYYSLGMIPHAGLFPTLDGVLEKIVYHRRPIPGWDLIPSMFSVKGGQALL